MSADAPVLSVEPAALETIVTLRDQEEGDSEFGLLIEVTGFRGNQFSYELSFVEVGEAAPGRVLERHGDLAIIFPVDDAEKLRGSTLSLTDEGLAMDNPNVPASPEIPGVTGTLEGPIAERVHQVLEQQVNPAIAGHGGAAELVSVDGSVAFLRLMGGCQGCGMAQVTLRHGIERILLDAIPELTGVVDVTDHTLGDNPYYEAAKK
jgi:Fe/S biogenesis protein NfuA